jgi:hypothetical protein
MKALVAIIWLYLALLSPHIDSYVHMCWYVNWSATRQFLPFSIENLEAAIRMQLCSHVIYSPAIINPETFDIEFINDLNSTVRLEIFKRVN